MVIHERCDYDPADNTWVMCVECDRGYRWHGGLDVMVAPDELFTIATNGDQPLPLDYWPPGMVRKGKVCVLR